MKYKNLTLLIALYALTTKVSAQDKPLNFGVKVYGGYGLFNPGTETYVDYTSNATGAFNKYKYGFGAGLHAGAGVSLKLNGVIGVGIDADYLTGRKKFSTSTNGDTVIGSAKSKHSVFSLIPNISFVLYSNQQYSIYNRMGLITAISTQVEFDNTSVSGPGNSTQFTAAGNMKYHYGVNLGFQDALGVQFKVAKNIKIFAELSGYYLSVNPQSSAANYITNSGGNTTHLISNTKYLRGNNNMYTSTYQQNGNTFTFNNTDGSYPQHIISIGINAGLVINLNR